MNIDQRDIAKGPLFDILPEFLPNSISYLSELNDYRMYAEVWSNKRSNERGDRSEIGHAGYLNTLKFGEDKKRRKVDRVRFDYFVAANSVNYKMKHLTNPTPYILLGGMETNYIFNKFIKADKKLLELYARYPGSRFHSEEFLPEALEISLMDLDLEMDEDSGRYYFEIDTGSPERLNDKQKLILFQIFGENAISEKLPLLHSVNRLYIRCLLEDPNHLKETVEVTSQIARMCVALPFRETIVIDFAAKREDYREVCLLGTLTESMRKSEQRKVSNVQQGDTDWLDSDTKPSLDSLA